MKSFLEELKLNYNLIMKTGNEAMRKQAERANEKLLFLVKEKKGFWFRIILELFSVKSVDNTNPK